MMNEEKAAKNRENVKRWRKKNPEKYRMMIARQRDQEKIRKLYREIMQKKTEAKD